MKRPAISALVHALLLPLILFFHPAAQAQSSASAEYERLARDLLRELIAINTTPSAGSTLEASLRMRDRMLAAGFPPEDVIVTEITPTKGNLVVRLPGRNPSLKPVLFLSHIDVVEADAADWTLPPFELIERDGYFFGRGTADDKDESAIHLTNLIRLRREGFSPERGIVVALTTDEEGGPDNGVVWLLENRRDLVDAEFVINEGGGGTVENGRKVANTVQASEKKFQNVIVEATNPGGHSSVPRPDNAIYELAAALQGIEKHRFPVRLNEITRAFFSRSAELVHPDTGAAMRAIVANPADARALAVLGANPRYNALLRTTCIATLLDAGQASNALPQRATANVNCRLLPDENPTDVVAALQAAAGRGVTVRLDGQATDSPPSPLAAQVLDPVEKVTREMWPNVPVVPVMSTGATDALYFRNAGIPVYGVSGIFAGDTFTHGMNERQPVDGFYEGLEFMYRLAKELADGSSPAQ